MYADKLMEKKEVSIRTMYRDEEVRMKATHLKRGSERRDRLGGEDDEEYEKKDRRHHEKEECPADYMMVLNNGMATITVCPFDLPVDELTIG